MKKSYEREKRALNKVTMIILVICAVIIAISTFFFIRGNMEKYDKIIAEYENNIASGHSFANIETLQFLSTDDVIEYQALIDNVLEVDGLQNVTNLTVLDTIMSSQDQGRYEWFIVCDDKNNSMYLNTFVLSEHHFTITAFDNEAVSAISDEDAAMIKEEAMTSDGVYVEGSISDIASMNPDIENISVLSAYISNLAGSSLPGKLRSFLVETGNNRRTFSIVGDVRDKGNEVEFVLKPDIILNKNDTIKAAYDKSLETFVFEYTD